MRILDWECVVNHDGNVRTARHATEGTAMWFAGKCMAHAAVPAEVFLWLIRPQLRAAWDQGCVRALQSAKGSLDENPYNGEPPNKDKAVS